MKRILGSVLVLLSTLCLGQEKKGQSIDKSLLWRISGNGLSKPSYLFGTMHIICNTNYLWTTKMAACLDSSNVVCFEMNIDNPEVMAKAAMAMMNNNGKTLESYFTKEQYQKLSVYIKDSMGVDISMVSNMNLVGVATLLSIGGGSCKTTVSYEEKIMDEAHKKKKQIVGLEEPEEQIALINKIPVDSMVGNILDIINGKKDDAEEYNKMVEVYTNQNLPELYEMIKNKKDDITDLNAFLDDRNKKWIDKMPALVKSGTVFFAVAAGHLWGTNGVIALMQKAGYSVVPEL